MMFKFPNFSDFPRNGFNFPDITYTLEREPQTYKHMIDFGIRKCRKISPDSIVSIDSFGHIFSGPIAINTGKRLVLARRAGKLPDETESTLYDMCYDQQREICLHSRSIDYGDKVLIVDDFLASGGTAAATAKLALKLGAKEVSAVFIAEIPDLKGREKLIQSGVKEIYSGLSLVFDKYSNNWNVVANRIIPN